MRGRGRREENKEKSFLGLEADKLIFDRWKADLAAGTVEMRRPVPSPRLKSPTVHLYTHTHTHIVQFETVQLCFELK